VLDALQAQRDVDPRCDRGVFRKDGEYWTISYEGNLFHLKDSTGLHYLSRLLREPGREFHALDLSRSDEECPLRSRPRPRGCFEQTPSALGLGSAGELLDEQAKAAYRRRMQELREELEEAVTWADPERASMLRRELEMFSEELARSVGLGGRDRIAASSSERARVNVTKAIRSALRRIARCNPPLAEHFGFAVRTGTFCSYDPDARSAVVWDS
jgi:non-specific serine/threonine protein kinase